MKNEDTATTVVEYQTRKIPSITFLAFALGAMCLSAALILSGKKQWANFVGQWVPTVLIMGVYNKIAKTFTPPLDEEQRFKHGDNRSEMKDRGGMQPQSSPGIGTQPITHS